MSSAAKSKLETLALSHLHLPARDPEALKKWYCQMLGFKPNGFTIWSGGTVLAFGPGEPIKHEQLHFGFRVASIEALKNWQAALREKGMEIEDLHGNEQYQSFYCTDPEGNDLEFFFEDEPA